MKSSFVDTLKANINKKVLIVAEERGEREAITAIVRFIDEEDGVIYDLIATDRPERYQRMGAKIPGRFLTPFEFITEVRELELTQT
jgi:hypothetical protein